MKLDLGHFKKISETHHSAVLKHPRGHHIVIAKKSLSPKLQKDLASLPTEGMQGSSGAGMEAPQAPAMSRGGKVRRYDEGGITASDMPADLHTDDSATSNEDVGDNSAPPMGGMPATNQSQPSGDAGAAQNYPVSAAPAQASNPMGQQMQGDMLNDLTGKFGAASQGIANEQQAKAVAFQNIANQEQEKSQTMKMMADNHQRFLDNLMNESLKTAQDMQSQKIDSNHYMNSMSAPGKAVTMIGLVLGGIGGGLLRQGNPALEALNNNINRDMQAQQMELGKKQNLLSAYTHLMGDANAGMAMTRASMLDYYGAMANQQAAQMNSKVAQSQNAQLQLQLAQQKQQILGPIAGKMSMMALLQSGQIDPAQAVPFMVPQHLQAQALKEIGQAQNVQKSGTAIMQAFDQASKENTRLRTGAITENTQLRTPASVQKIQALILPIIKDQEGRVNEYEMATLNNLIPKPGDTAGKIAEKRMGLQQFLNGKSAATTNKAYGIDLQRFRSTKEVNQPPLNPRLQNKPSGVAYQPGQ